MAADELDVLPGTLDNVPRQEMMSAYLLKQVDEAWEQWKATYEEVKTPEQIEAYVQHRRERFEESRVVVIQAESVRLPRRTPPGRPGKQSPGGTGYALTCCPQAQVL